MSSYHEYFPVAPQPKFRYHRNIFESFNEHTHVLVHHTEGLGFRTYSQRPLPDNLYNSFTANSPSMPFLPPVNLKEFQSEPCLEEIRKDDLTKDAAVKKISRASKNINGILSLGAAFDCVDCIGTNCAPRVVNRDYTYGNMAFVSHVSGSCGGVLFYASGADRSYLNAVKVGVASGGEPVAMAASKYRIRGGGLYSVHAAGFSDHMYCLGRSAHQVDIYSLSSLHGNTAHPTLLPVRSLRDTDSSRLTGAALSPHSVLPEFMCVNVLGTGLLCRLDSKTIDKCALQAHHRGECADPSWQCYWALHPRQVVLTDPTGVALFDLRAHNKHRTCDLLSLPHAALKPHERLGVARPHANLGHYHYAATTNHVLLLDQRFPNHPVLKWAHLLLSPPSYMDVLYDMAHPGAHVSHVFTQLVFAAAEPDYAGSTSLPARDLSAVDAAGAETAWRELVLLGCQEHPECHVFPVTPSTGGTPPAWAGEPWRVSRPVDFSYLSGYGTSELAGLVETQRLSAPLSGIAGFRHSGGRAFTCFQMTSYGDLFQQSYQTTEPEPCDLIPGSNPPVSQVNYPYQVNAPTQVNELEDTQFGDFNKIENLEKNRDQTPAPREKDSTQINDPTQFNDPTQVNDPTLSSGPGSKQLQLTEALVQRSWEWLRRAEHSWLRGNNTAEPEREVCRPELQPAVDEKRKPHYGCAFCRRLANRLLPFRGHTCGRCGSVVEQSHAVTDALHTGSLISSVKNDDSCGLENFLSAIDLDATGDAQGQIVARLWQDEHEIPTQLLHQHDDEFRGMFPEVKPLPTRRDVDFLELMDGEVSDPEEWQVERTLQRYRVKWGRREEAVRAQEALRWQHKELLMREAMGGKGQVSEVELDYADLDFAEQDYDDAEAAVHDATEEVEEVKLECFSLEELLDMSRPDYPLTSTQKEAIDTEWGDTAEDSVLETTAPPDFLRVDDERLWDSQPITGGGGLDLTSQSAPLTPQRKGKRKRQDSELLNTQSFHLPLTDISASYASATRKATVSFDVDSSFLRPSQESRMGGGVGSQESGLNFSLQSVSFGPDSQTPASQRKKKTAKRKSLMGF